MPLNPPDIKELQAIVDWVNVTDDVRELSLKYGEVELFISRNRQVSGAAVAPAPAAAPAAAAPVTAAPAAAPAAPVAAPAPAAPVASGAPAASAELAVDEVLITAPLVGPFSASPQPGAPAFVSVGDRVAADTVLGIVEVMKLMNNIEAGVTGTIARVLVENEQAVEYGQPLMVITRDA
jgi:acetyl-CoA carboxylase biotin carboxyl carrier protein